MRIDVALGLLALAFCGGLLVLATALYVFDWWQPAEEGQHFEPWMEE